MRKPTLHVIPGKRCVTAAEAEIVQRQHTHPCADCPFTRTSLPGWLGGLSAEEWMQLAHGEGKADCHALRLKKSDLHCAGLAVYRANVCKVPWDPKAMKLPPDRERVFSSPKEFLAHHSRGLGAVVDEEDRETSEREQSLAEMEANTSDTLDGMD